MRYFLKKCIYCKDDKYKCEFYKEQKEFFKKISLSSVKSISINCSKFQPIAKIGDVIEFEMNGFNYIRQVVYASENNKTFFVLIAKNNKQYDIFTKYVNDKEKYYFIKDYWHNNNKFMVGVVNYKFIKKVLRNQIIDDNQFFETFDNPIFKKLSFFGKSNVR